MQITYKELQAKGACADQLALFKKHFGPSVVVTLEAVLAVADVFNWDWAARNLMSPKACKVYQDAIAPACKVYDDAIAPAQKAYRDAKMPIWKAYEDAIAPAQKAYEDAIASAGKAYDDAIVSAWFTAWEMDHSA